MRSEGVDEEGGGTLWVLTVDAEGRCNPLTPSVTQQAHGSGAEHATDLRSLPRMDAAGILAQADIFGTVTLILDSPMLASELEEAGGGPDEGREADDAVANLLFALHLLPPGSLDTDEVGDTRPVRECALCHLPFAHRPYSGDRLALVLLPKRVRALDLTTTASL